MRKEIREYEVYEFKELSKEAKEKALERFQDINVDYDWWEHIYDDANAIGLKLEGFDLYRREISGELTESIGRVIANIFANHGETCGTYEIAKRYEKKLIPFTVLESMEIEDMDNEDEMEELTKEFRKELLQKYLSILQNEYEYLTSEETVVEAIEANEYEFTKDGKLFY